MKVRPRTSDETIRICVLLLIGSHSLIPWTTPSRTPAPRTNATSVGLTPPDL